MTGTMPAFQFAIFMKAGFARSKCVLGGLHHPPLLESFNLDICSDHPMHRIWKQVPHTYPFLNRAELGAAVSVPWPLVKRFPYPQAPPEMQLNQYR